MFPASRSVQEEADFMNSLLAGLDNPNDAKPASESFPRSLSKTCNPQTPPRPSKIPITPTRERATRPSPSKTFSASDVDMDVLLAGSEEWDLDDFSDILSPRKSPKKSSNDNSYRKSIYTPEPCTRCAVQSVTETMAGGRPEKHLVVRVDRSDECRSIILQDDWVATDVRVGDVVNVIGRFTLVTPSSSSITFSITITSKSNLLILHPDILLTSTALSNAPQCRRKPMLSNLVRSSTDISPSLVWGNILHEVMQACLVAGRWEQKWINEKIDEVIDRGLPELVKINASVAQARHEVRARANGLIEFSKRYISSSPKGDAILTDTRLTRTQTPSLLAISEMLDVEEEIFSPSYGIKGKLDVTVDAVISDPGGPLDKLTATRGPKPFEIKTGRSIAAMEHRAQTMLYTILASERYGVEVPSGLLYYTQSEEVVHVPTSRNEVRGLFMARNEMVGYMTRKHQNVGRKVADGEVAIEDAVSEPFLPPTIDDEHACKRCFVLDACMLYRKAIENVVDTASPIADTYEMKTAHLTYSQSQFFKKWEALLSMEEQDSVRFRKELWTMGAAEREAKGRCFSNMILDTSFRPSQAAPTNRVHRYTYRFVRDTTAYGSPIASLLNGHMDTGEAITISVEPVLLALARGYILELSPAEVVIGVDHELCVDKIKQRLLEHPSAPSSPLSPQAQVVFRIDKDEMSTGMSRIRDNLAQLFYAGGDKRRLELVVDLKPPVFDDEAAALADIPPHLAPFSAELNASQRMAIGKVLAARDFALVLGMPGTGKTTVIAAIIKTLVGMGKTILLTSYTHSAVDTILLKLQDADFGILRIGNVDRVHPDVRKYTLESKKKATTIEQLEHQLMTPSVVATTCLSIDHAVFNRRCFDYCIVDEASQITLPTCLGPLRFADRFVLVGDHFQLPPLVRNPAARKGGLDVSLFRRLSDTHPQAVVDLTSQYRMNKDIMLLSNKLIYSDRLQCGSVDVAEQTLKVPDRSFLNRLHPKDSVCQKESCWIEQLLAESCRAVFVATDAVPAVDSRVGDLVQNEVEADLVCQIVETMIHCGVSASQMGIISLYRQQIKLLSHQLHHRQGIEILTADKSQGRDKDCIIISLVRSNEDGQIGDLVKDWRRMNVSFTRARSKLIIIGSRKTLQKAALLADFFQLVEAQNWILRLPPDAHKLHSFAFEMRWPLSNKRSADDVSSATTQRRGKENREESNLRPEKKVKVQTLSSKAVLLKSRPILRDLVMDCS